MMWFVLGVLYMLVGIALAEGVRRSSEEDVRDFWVTDLFGNLCVACVWPLPLVIGVVTTIGKRKQ
jgi:hypothetical protein